MKISREKLLNTDTWVDYSTHTVITSEMTWENNTNKVYCGFNIKANITDEEFAKALNSVDPKNYIFKSRTINEAATIDRPTHLSVDEALCLVNDSASDFCPFQISGKHRYYIEFCPQEPTDDDDHRYWVQTGWFASKAEAISWYKDNFCYVDSKHCFARLVTAQELSNGKNDDYDIVSVEILEAI